MSYIISLLFSTDYSIAQKPYPIKEQYDYIHSKAVFNGNYGGILNYLEMTNPLSGYEYGEQLGFVLESYINMYKTTGDKAYLIKFINEALLIMSWRNTDYKFTNDDGYQYMNGLILWPMAHFSNLILYQEQNLQNTVIPADLFSIPNSTFSSNVLPLQSTYSFGYLADWLLHRQVETLDVIIASHWMGDDKGFKGKTDDNYPMGINMQAGFGGALLYLGQVSSNVPAYSGLASYLYKGAAMARLYKSDIDIDDRCNCILYKYPLLRTTSNNSYWWYHSGWRIEKKDFCLNSCFPLSHINQPKYPEYTQFVEDISHAVTTLIIPQVSFEINLFTNGGYPFSNNEMIRFRNMFTKNIFDGNFSNPGFHNATNGADAPVYPSSYNNQFNILRYSSLGYMPLYKFDGADGTATPPSVYDIVSNFYANEVLTSPTSLSGGLYYNGLSQTVSAQWDKECVNLTLYNRKMVYDQNFIIKDNLVVAPGANDNYYQPGDNSFAEPIINSDRFTIEPGIIVNMIAGESVLLNPGFHAKTGAIFQVSINPSACPD